jgi:hypothetical protein
MDYLSAQRSFVLFVFLFKYCTFYYPKYKSEFNTVFRKYMSFEYSRLVECDVFFTGIKGSRPFEAK